jgi:valyl-tRNA synthetase
LNVIDAYGTDAFRFTLAAFAAQGRDVKMSEKRVEGYRHFINKLWNAARFSLMHIEQGYDGIDEANISLQDRWIISRLNRVVRQTETALDAYKFNEAAGAVYQFVWHELCDWYLESIKPILYDSGSQEKKSATLSVLWHVLKEALVLMHPFAPFVTEEIWHSLPGTNGSIMKADWPQSVAPGEDKAVEQQMDTIMAVITGVRNVRGEMNISPSTALDIAVLPEDTLTGELIEKNQPLISNLARLASITVDSKMSRPKAAATVLVNGATVFILLEGIIDFAQEHARLEKEIGKLSKELGGMSKKLGNEDFLKKAPPAVVDGVKEKHAAMLEKKQALETTQNRIQEMMD